MNPNPEEKAIGRDNYYEAVGVNRRDFMKEIIAAGAVSGAGLGAMYFGYDTVADPVKIGVIGTGDEGCVLLGACNPNYVSVAAIADIRPSSIHRAFHGDWASPAALAARPGLNKVYGENVARKTKVYTSQECVDNPELKEYNPIVGGYEALLADPEIEGIIIALPLHLHAKVAVKAMQAGKHVLTEKLMAQTVAQCKTMSLVAEKTGKLLATGHQRHYSILYDNAVNLLKWGILGEIHHIRAQWHRGNLPGRDSWAQALPGGEGGRDTIMSALKSMKEKYARGISDPKEANLIAQRIKQWTAWDLDKIVKAEDHGYEDITLANGRERTALEELVRWRLWERTGGGLMAELGSHQLDASTIFISALHSARSGKPEIIHPLTVHAVGGRHIFPLDREAAHHVYCTFASPAPGYSPNFDVGYKDPVSDVPGEDGIPSYSEDQNKKIVVTYSSINGNGYGGYGEIIMGTKGTLVLEKESEVMLFAKSSNASKVSVSESGATSVIDTQASGPAAPAAKAATSGPVSRGYTEEIEHWAWCIRNPGPENLPRCRPEIAVADAVIALTSNEAIKNSAKGGGYIRFEDAWFDIHSPATSDGSSLAETIDALVAGPLKDELINEFGSKTT